jgi:hypothetical protein
LAPPAAAAGDSWFTFVGDPVDPQADTLQIRADSVAAIPGGRSVEVRANLAREAPASDGQGQRSFTALVVIDCARSTARLQHGTLFSGPLWTGSARALEHREEDMPALVFHIPAGQDPVQRLVLAGCGFASVQSR